MNKYVCTKCGRFSYSAASLEYLYDDQCAYPDCDGHLKEEKRMQPMDKLINLAALQNYPLRRGNPGCDEINANPHFLNGIESIIEFAEDVPTIDPVRHARWMDDMYFDEPVTRCTACKRGFAKGHKAERFPYCPNCGARMDTEPRPTTT